MRMKGLPGEMEHRLGHLFEPHAIMPIQFFALRERSRWSGEQRLMAAVLEDAITVYSRPDVPKASKARQLLRETERWLRSNDRTWTFSFLRVCEVLGLEPSAIRRRLRQRRDEQATRPIDFTASEMPRRVAVG
jgi:hypothetical protein